MLDFMFTLKRQHYELGPHLPMRLDACLSVASQIVDEIEILGKNGVLGVMQDTASCMTSSLGIFFHKVLLDLEGIPLTTGVHDRDHESEITHGISLTTCLVKSHGSHQRG